jgi:IMP dehydrogenase
MDLALSFDDVLLRPLYSEIESRFSDISIDQTLVNLGQFDLPVISSPMDTVTETEMAISIHHAGGLGIIHRYNTINEQSDMVAEVAEEGIRVGAAIGVTGDFVERATALRDAGANLLCLDVAHGHHANVRYALGVLRKTFGDGIHIMAGNVATLEGFNDLADWGADSIRVGIGGGSICSTRMHTGHGVPTLQSILDCAQSDRDVIMVADGGIRTSGDMVKALAAGADFVMAGSLFAGTEESPGEVITNYNGTVCKVYRGMASKEAQHSWRGRHSSIEGITHNVPLRGPLNVVLDEIDARIRSGLSYSGVTNIPELQIKRRFIRQTSAGQIESSTHIIRNGL